MKSLIYNTHFLIDVKYGAIVDRQKFGVNSKLFTFKDKKRN